MTNEPNDFGPRVSMRAHGSVLINPMVMLARAVYEHARGTRESTQRKVQARKRPHRARRK